MDWDVVTHTAGPAEKAESMKGKTTMSFFNNRVFSRGFAVYAENFISISYFTFIVPQLVLWQGNRPNSLVGHVTVVLFSVFFSSIYTFYIHPCLQKQRERACSVA